MEGVDFDFLRYFEAFSFTQRLPALGVFESGFGEAPVTLVLWVPTFDVLGFVGG